MKAKSEVPDRIEEFKELLENQIQRRVKCVRNDNGGGYTSSRFGECYAKNGIMPETSAP
ncbi:hypothetical protein PI124_g20509 [Phytophthora idaei]|nr:hypothetical protein PI125_g11399 [Phytophthora idaei]KAG3131340.1 hypothetical protein PI126_g20106 [Phytophthora idaei]KAG3234438.1 hypothetical protein PI124_g20509 [Phytophthora idaei]